jgi:chitin synthase
MTFLSKVMFDERMTELEFDIFFKLWTISGVHPDMYEAVLLVDADTILHVNAISHLVAALIRDPLVIGACGETTITNKFDSWVTTIQVFEYFISHHFNKAFESVFGCVTCLPGCFSIYRIKTRQPNGQYAIPVLANPDIVHDYSEFEVETLHV